MNKLVICLLVLLSFVSAWARPTGLTATVFSSTRIDLAWDAGPAGDTYIIYRSTAGPTTGFTEIARTTVAGAETYMVLNLSPATTYWFQVATNQYSNVSSATTQANDSMPPSVPTNLTASNVTCSSVTLTWGASVDNAGGSGLYAYYVYVNDQWTAYLPAGTTTWTGGNVPPGQPARYKVHAVDYRNNYSNFTPILTVNIPAC